MRDLNLMHIVERGETILQIAERYEVPVEDLINSNPRVKVKKNGKVKKGTILAIPAKQEPKEEKPLTEEVKQVRMQYDLVKMAVLLPLEEKSDRGEKFVEFYRGMLMAADSLKRQGLNLEIHTFSCGSKASEMENILKRNPQLKLMNVIFGPADEDQIPALAQFCGENNIRLVLPFNRQYTNVRGPYMYTTIPFDEVIIEEAVNLTVRVHPGKNFVIVKTHQEDEKGELFTDLLTARLASRGISVKVLDIDGDDFAYEASMNQFVENCLVPDATSLKALNILLGKLSQFRKLHGPYKICLQGYPEWRAYTSMILNEMHQNDTHIYSTYYYNPVSTHTDEFQRRFHDNFNEDQIVSYPRFGMMGFDLAYYFLNGLYRTGDTFEDRQESVAQMVNPYQHVFSFRKEDATSGFVNRFVQMIHYSPSHQIDLLR